MELNLITIVILLLVLFAGYGIGLLEMYLRPSRRESKEDVNEVEPASAEAKSNLSPPAGDEILHLWMNPAGKMKMLLDGKAIELPESSTPEQRRRLIAIISQIRPWLESAPVVAEPVAAAPQAASVQTPQIVPVPTPAPQAVKRAVPVKGIAEMSIVEQIDEILQARLEGTPLAERGIQLKQSPSGGVIVWVGKAHYDTIDAVPDADVVAVIRAAISKWEDQAK
ncbi:MAG: hypothetical protein ABIJ39_11500 [Chloroflexota bacterium]